MAIPPHGIDLSPLLFIVTFGNFTNVFLKIAESYALILTIYCS